MWRWLVGFVTLMQSLCTITDLFQTVTMILFPVFGCLTRPYPDLANRDILIRWYSCMKLHFIYLCIHIFAVFVGGCMLWQQNDSGTNEHLTFFFMHHLCNAAPLPAVYCGPPYWSSSCPHSSRFSLSSRAPMQLGSFLLLSSACFLLSFTAQ